MFVSNFPVIFFHKILIKFYRFSFPTAEKFSTFKKILIKMGKKPYIPKSSANRRRQKQKDNKKRKVVVKNQILKNAWDDKKSIHKNMADMGLSVDPNKSLKVPTLKDQLTQQIQSFNAQGDYIAPESKSDESTESAKQIKNPKPLELLEKESERKFDSKFQVSVDQVHFCIHMIEKYQDNYKKMSMDYKNFYQLTPSQIKKQIDLFKKSGSWKDYLEVKEAAESQA